MRKLPGGFRIGDGVHKEMGIRMDGIVCTPFHWKQSTDGTFQAPNKGYIAISWDDGTCGYCHISHLKLKSRLTGR